MLRLSPAFYITSIETQNRWHLPQSKLNKERAYHFRYREFKITLRIAFEVVGYTSGKNMAIVNFGYEVEIERWSERKQRFYYIEGIDGQDGRSTKKYLDSKEARALMMRFVERNIARYLRRVSPAIVIRGALSKIETGLPRYRRLDKPFFECGYHKKVFAIDESDTLYRICVGEKREEDSMIWVYCKDARYFQKLENVFV